MVEHLIERLAAQIGLVHRNEPLVGCTENDRVLAAPAMRIAVVDLLLGNERTALAQKLDDVRISLIGVHAGEGAARSQAVTCVEVAIVINRHDDRQVAAHARVIVVHAMARGGMNAPGTIFKRNVIGSDDPTLYVAENRVRIGDVDELFAVDAPRFGGTLGHVQASILDAGHPMEDLLPERLAMMPKRPSAWTAT